MTTKFKHLALTNGLKDMASAMDFGSGTCTGGQIESLVQWFVSLWARLHIRLSQIIAHID